MPDPRLPHTEQPTASLDGMLDRKGPSPARAVRCYLLALSTDKGPRLLAFQAGNLLLGRLPDNHLSINHVSVSRRHARISVGARGVTIEDMGSQNGTSVNGVQIKGEHPIRPGDILRLGHVPVFYFGFIDPDNPPQAERIDSAVSVTPSQTVVG